MNFLKGLLQIAIIALWLHLGLVLLGLNSGSLVKEYAGCLIVVFIVLGLNAPHEVSNTNQKDSNSKD